MPGARAPHLGPRGDLAQHVGRRHPPARRGHGGVGRRGERLGRRGGREQREEQEPEEARPHAAGTPKCSRTIGTMSRSDHWSLRVRAVGPGAAPEQRAQRVVGVQGAVRAAADVVRRRPSR